MSDQSQFDPSPRFGTEERDYLLGRADDHRDLAGRAEDAGTRAIHMRLHTLYTEQAARAALVVPD